MSTARLRAWWFRHDHLIVGLAFSALCFAGAGLSWRWALTPVDYLAATFFLVMAAIFAGVAWLGARRRESQ